MQSTFLPAARKSWSSEEIRKMRELAAQHVSIEMMSAVLRKTPSAIRNKAAMHGISLQQSRRAPGWSAIGQRS